MGERAKRGESVLVIAEYEGPYHPSDTARICYHGPEAGKCFTFSARPADILCTEADYLAQRAALEEARALLDERVEARDRLKPDGWARRWTDKARLHVATIDRLLGPAEETIEEAAWGQSCVLGSDPLPAPRKRRGPQGGGR